MRNFKGLLTTSFHQSGRRQARLHLNLHLAAQCLRPTLSSPTPSTDPIGVDLGDGGQTLSVCRQLEPRGPRTLDSCPQPLRDAKVPAVSLAPGLAFNCHPFLQTDTHTDGGCLAELSLNLNSFKLITGKTDVNFSFLNTNFQSNAHEQERKNLVCAEEGQTQLHPHRGPTCPLHHPTARTAARPRVQTRPTQAHVHHSAQRPWEGSAS